MLSLLKQDYYGKTLKHASDLKTNACVAPVQPTPAFIRRALKKVHPEITARLAGCCWALRSCIHTSKSLILICLCLPPHRYYGCGLVVPECLEGCRILDLGSGSGRDCYMLSQLVGEKGHVTGIDMTESQVSYISVTVLASWLISISHLMLKWWWSHFRNAFKALLKPVKSLLLNTFQLFNI